MTGQEPTPAEVAFAALQRRFQAEMVAVNRCQPGGVRDNHLAVAFSVQLAADELAYALGVPPPGWAQLRDEAFARFLRFNRNGARVTHTGLPLNQEQTRAISARDVQVSRALARPPASDPLPPVQKHRLRLLDRVHRALTGGGQ